MSNSVYFGGSPPVIGGVKDLLEYASSRSMKNKEQLIRNIASDLKRALGVPGIDPNTNIDKLIGQLKNLLSQLKDKTVNDDKPIQSKLCNELAKSLNARYGKVIINLDDAPKEICRKVKEVSHTLFAGLHNEFLAIAGDVQTSMKNIGLLRQHLAAAFTKIMNSINESSDESLKMEAAQIQMYHKNIDEELSRQMAILTNIMSGVIDPVTGNLVALLEESEEFAGFVERIKDDLGTDEFGKKLSQLLAGVNQVAQVAYVVDKALKKIGMSVKEYKNTKGIANLRLKIYDLLMAKGTKLRARDIQTFMQAAEIIYKNDYAHDDIVKYLEKKKGGHYGGNDIPIDVEGDPIYDYAQDSLRTTTGGVTERKKKSLEYRIEQQKKYRRLIFKDFEKRLQPEYNKIINAVHAIAPFIGNEIPVNDALLDFVKVFQNIQEVDQENFHVILTGYRRDAYSKDERNKFLETLNSISRIVSHLSSGPKGEQFRRIKSAIDNLVSIIDTFKDKFLKAITAVAIESKGVAEKGLIRAYGQYEEGGGKKMDRMKKLKEKAKKKAAEAAKKVQEDPRIQQSISQLQDVGIEAAQKAIDVSAEAVSQRLDQATAMTEGLSPGVEMSNIPAVSGRADNIEDIDTEFPAPLEDEQINMYQGMQSSGLVSGISDTSPETPDEELMSHDVMASSLSHTYPEYVGHGEYSGGDDYSSGVDGYSTITRASRDLQYYIHIAQIRGNLKSLPQELADFDENYTTILGNAAAGMLEKTRKNYEKMNNSIGAGVGEVEMKERVRPLNVDMGLYNAFKFLTTAANVGNVAAEVKRWRQIKANSLKFSKMKYEAQKELIEVAQAIDLYMKAFARAIAERPDTIKNLNSMLDSVKIVAKFFSETSGNFIAKLYEELPNEYRAGDNPEHKDAEVYSTMADNVEHDNVSGWKLKLKDSQHYYERLVDLMTHDNTKTPGHPFKAFLLTDDKYKSICDSTKSVLKSFRVLDNIISTFTRLGDSVINTKSSSQTFMSAGQMFNKLINYMTWATWTQGYQDGVEMKANATGYGDAHKAGQLVSGPWREDFADAAQIAAVKASPPGGNVVTYAKYVRQQCGISMNSIPVVGGAGAPNSPYGKEQTSVSGYEAYQDTDRLFEQCIKALVVKPFITLNLYRIFHHPSTMDHPLRPIRTILGGSRGGALTKIKPEALEVYIRLPLMAEWYRGVFKFQKIDDFEDPVVGIPEKERSIFDREEDTEDGGSGLRKISMVPEIDMVWSNIIRLIFDEAKYVNHGTYSDAQVDKIIAEVNAIYDRFKSVNPKNPVGAILVAFRDEINRRYGIVKQEEINKYFEERDKRWEDYDAKDLSERDRVDQFDILDAEDQLEMGTRPAPSDKFMTVGAVLRGKRKDQFTWKFKEILDNFRNTIDEKLSETDPVAIRTSFYHTIRQHKHDLQRATSEEDKYKIVRRAIQGVDKLAGIHNNKLLIFHEMISVPLETLYHLYCSIKYYNDTINMFDPDVLKRAIQTASAANQNFNDIRWRDDANKGTFQTALDTVSAYSHKFTDGPSFAKHYFKSDVLQTIPELVQFASSSIDAGIAGANDDVKFPSQNQFTGTDQVKRFAALAFKYGLDWHKIFRTVSQLVWSMGDSLNHLVDVRQDGHKILVDYSKLQETIELLLNNIRKTVNRFRGVLPQDILHRFEKGRHVGSIYWLEENFIEILFKNRDDNGLPRTNEIINGVYKYIINSKKTDSPLYSKIVPAALDGEQSELYEEKEALEIVNPANAGGSDLSMEREFAKMIYWDTLQPNLFPDGPNKFVDWAGMNNYPFNLLPLFELDKEPVDAKEKEEAVTFKKFLEEAGRKHAELAQAKAAKTLFPEDEIKIIDRLLLDISNAIRAGGAAVAQDTTYMDITDLAGTHNFASATWPALGSAVAFRNKVAVIGNRIDNLQTSPVADIQEDIAVIIRRFKEIYNHITSDVASPPAARASRHQVGILWDAVASVGDAVPGVNDNPRGNAKFHFAAALVKADNNINVAQAAIDAIMVGKHELLAKFDFPYFKRANWYNVSSNNFLLDRPGRKRKLFNSEQSNNYYRDEFHDENNAEAPYTANYHSWDSPYKGLVVRFNETLAKFVNTFYDGTIKKIYLPLIETFATGNQNRAVMHGDALNDLIFETENRLNTNDPVDNWYAEDTFRIGDPPPGVILFASIAKTLKTLIQEVDKTTKQSKHTATSLSDLPNHLIESMRCNLPIFIKLFELHMQRAEFIKKLLAMDFPAHRTVYKHHVETNRNLRDVNNQPLPVVAGPANQTVKHRGDFPYDDEKNNYNKYNRPGNKLFVRYTAYDAGAVDADTRLPRGAKVEKASYFKRYLDSIISACQAIQKNAKKVYRELEDAPLYLELEADSISNYVQRYNRSPIMPHSTMSWVMRPVADMDLVSDNVAEQGSVLMPGYSVGQDQFKFNYGTRGVLQRWDVKPALDYFPGMKLILSGYNGVADVGAQMDVGHFTQMLEKNTVLLRYISDNKFYKKMLGGHILYSMPISWDPAAVAGVGAWGRNALIQVDSPDPTASCAEGDNIVDGKSKCKELVPLALAYFDNQDGGVPTYRQNKVKLSDLMAITENSFVEENIKKITTLLKPEEPEMDTRAIIRKINIIDMNIVPINVHALQREIPFINLFNYSYTFDRMIFDILVPQTGIYSNNKIPNKSHADIWRPKTTSEALAKLCIHPYSKLTREDYYGWLRRLVTGDSGLDLGRPKFLGDQLWNKALFQELYAVSGATRGLPPEPHKYFPDEGGPRTDSVAWRTGRAPGQIGQNLAERYVTIDPALRTDVEITFPPAIKHKPWSRKQMRKETGLASAHVEQPSGELRERKVDTQSVPVTKQSMVGRVRFPVGDFRDDADEIGRLRFDTTIMRTMWLLTSIQRVQRMVFRDELNYIESPIAVKAKVLSKSVTEYGPTEKWSRAEDTDPVTMF